MERTERIAQIIKECVKFDPTHGLQGVDEAAKRIDNIGKWECIDDTTYDWDGYSNWRAVENIKVGDAFRVTEMRDTSLRFHGKKYWHDITKFKQL